MAVSLNSGHLSTLVFQKNLKTNMLFKAIYGEQQSTRKIYTFTKNHKLLEPLSSNGMKSSDFVADRSCFCLLRSVVYVQRLQSGVNSVSRPHLLIISSNFIRHSFPKNKIMFLKVVYNNSKRHIWENLSSI